MNDLNYKCDSMLEVERYERAILELKSWSVGEVLSESTLRLTGEITNDVQKDSQLQLLKNICSETNHGRETYNQKFFLSEIVEKEKPKFGLNNLILAPTGSGKSKLMENLITTNSVLLLVSTTSLKDKLAPNNNKEKEVLNNRMYTTKNSRVYGRLEEKNYSILVMTYSEFGEKIKFTNNFANNFKEIFCDEIHSLFNYYSMYSTDTLLVAIRYLFEKREGQRKYYFTATDEYLENIKEQSSDLFQNVLVFNYLAHPEIKKHMVLSSYKINNLEQVRPHLKAKRESFEYFGYKIFAFCKTIASEKYLEEIMLSEGFKPLVLWSVNNKENEMSEEQLKHRDYILRTGLIPEEYDSLIVNSAMQEGWDLLDPKVKLTIMNTTNKTEFIQAIGRVRRDVDVLVYRVDSNNADLLLKIPEEFLGNPLTPELKEDLIELLNIRNKNGRLLKWPSLSKILIENGFSIENKVIVLKNIRSRVSIITK